MANQLAEIGTLALSNFQEENQEIATNLSTLEFMPVELFFKILDFCWNIKTLSSISSTSKQFYDLTSRYVINKIKMSERVAQYLPRTLSQSERELSILMQLHILRQIVNTDSFERTPLTRATIATGAKPWEKEVIRILVLLGADIDQQVKGTWTAIRYADYWGYTATSALLRELRNEFPRVHA